MRHRLSAVLIFLFSLLLIACSPSDDQGIEEQAQPVTDAEGVNVEDLRPGETEEERARRLRATFPAQQRAPGDPEVIARGEAMYGINCRSCHGQDLRGGDLGGPNLLRSPVVLSDQAGEEIIPVVQNGRSSPGMPEMPALTLEEGDIRAIAEYIHSVVATSQRQGAPPPVDIELDILVGDADAGKAYFDQTCAACHSVTGDLAGFAGKVRTPENVQDSWVAGNRRGAPPDPDAEPDRRAARAIITLSNGEVVAGKLGRRDDFFISVTTDEGVYRSFTLFENTSPSVTDVVIDDPMQRHRELMSELTDEDMHDVTAYLVTLQ